MAIPTHTDGILKTHDGLKLHTIRWDSLPPAKADIAFVHGFFEHSGRYSNEAQFFTNAGYNFLAYDQRSHGLSEGKYRSFVKDFSNYERDYKLFLKENNLGKNRPYFLFSHSMGGLVQCSYLLDTTSTQARHKGSIFSAPLLSPDPNTAPLLQKMSGVVGTLLPRLKVIAIDANAVSRDPKEIEKYVNDPLNYTDKMYAASGFNLLKQMKKIQPLFSTLTHPFLVLHGTDDKLSDIGGSQTLYDQAASLDKEYMRLENFKHEITKDIDHHIVLNKILTWMDNRVD